MKTNKHNEDFLTHAKEVMGDERFTKALKKGQEKVHKLRLKMAREMVGLNQTDLPGISQPEVSKIENRKDLKISTLDKYAKSMGMKVRISLVSEDDEQQITIYG